MIESLTVGLFSPRVGFFSLVTSQQGGHDYALYLLNERNGGDGLLPYPERESIPLTASVCVGFVEMKSGG